MDVDEKLRAILKDHRFCGWSRKFHLAAAYVRERGVQPKHDIVSKDVHGVEHKIGRWLIDQRQFHKKGTLGESRVKMLKHAGLELTNKHGSGSVHRTKNGRWKAIYKGKHVGTFDTEAQAETANLARKEKILRAEGKKPLKE